jgi:hypothetical protein
MFTESSTLRILPVMLVLLLVTVRCFSTSNQIGISRTKQILKLHGGCDSSTTIIEADVSQGNDELHNTLELRKENENLRMQLFWKDFGLSKLKKAMYHGNCASYGPKCKCLPCTVSGRVRKNGDDSFDCSFKPWFEEQVAACGMITGHCDGKGSINHDSNVYGVYDVDCHLVYIGRMDWKSFTYGSRIWKARTPNVPEIVKLKKLFALIDERYESDEESNANERGTELN